MSPYFDIANTKNVSIQNDGAVPTLHIMLLNMLKNSIKPCMIPVINDGGSDGSLLDMMYGRLPMIGKRGGPGGKLLGFSIAL